jgi:tRNA(Arg) A34 adenosine deaminase TadA
MSPREEELLLAAIELAAAAGAAGELPYGSLLADRDGEVVATEQNSVRSSRDITAHPELKLARWAALIYPLEQRMGLTLYTSCEPCSMCAEAIARAGLRRVVYALSTVELRALQPDGAQPPTAADVAFEGPALLEAARQPIREHYRTRS